jgi:hypothetical protein
MAGILPRSKPWLQPVKSAEAVIGQCWDAADLLLKVSVKPGIRHLTVVCQFRETVG